MKVFCLNERNPSCMLGPHCNSQLSLDYVFLPTLAVITVLLVLMFTSSYPLLTTFWRIVIGLSITLCIISYLLVGFSNPGIQTNSGDIDAEIIQRNKINAQFCHRCNVVRASGTRHCLDCDICIKGHDHHCPWIGKCVGSENKGRFYFFLLMIFGTVIIFFISVVSSKV